MTKKGPLARLLACLAAVMTSVPAPLFGADLELFMDTQTRQLYAEAGPDRVRLGTFRSVEEAPQAVSAITPVDTETTVIKLAALERRLEENELEIEELLDRNAGLRIQSSWTESFQLRGYLQNRHTTMLGGDKGINLWSDRSVGDDESLGDADKNFLIRRARLVFLGDVGERLSFYIQPDLASSAGSTGHIMQMRDAYGDFYLSTDRVHRLRVGQSKVPYGFENLQSSSNRLALDRNDALNSAVRDERDLGAFYYYTPREIQARFGEINSLGLKHSGNYGMFGLGFYNGQGANRADRNDNKHTVIRFSYPWKLADGQFVEAGIQAYTGNYVPATGAWRGSDDVSRTPLIPAEFRNGHSDDRVALSFMWYPQPFGLQAEWNWGTTPQLDMATNTIVEGDLNGGYVQAMLKLDNDFGTFLPFVKWQYFEGANKAETNAPVNQVNDIELGVEWQIASAVELAAIYHRMKRNNLVTGNRSGRPDYAAFETDALRIQLQYNY